MREMPGKGKAVRRKCVKRDNNFAQVSFGTICFSVVQEDNRFCGALSFIFEGGAEREEKV